MLDEILLIECDFRLSSIEALFYKGLIGFLGGILMIFDGVKMGEMLDFVGFARTHYRSGVLSWIWVKCLGNADFTRGLWIEQMCRFIWRTNVLKM